MQKPYELIINGNSKGFFVSLRECHEYIYGRSTSASEGTYKIYYRDKLQDEGSI